MVRGDGHDPHAERGTGATFLCIGPGWSSLANTPFRRHKTWVHEGGISTPLIVHWPKGIAARGELRHTPGHVIDLVPTILEVAGGKRPRQWDGKPVPPPPGKSLVPVFAKDGTVDARFDLVAARGQPRAARRRLEDRRGRQGQPVGAVRPEFRSIGIEEPRRGQAGESARTGGDLDQAVRRLQGFSDQRFAARGEEESQEVGGYARSLATYAPQG